MIILSQDEEILMNKLNDRLLKKFGEENTKIFPSFFDKYKYYIKRDIRNFFVDLIDSANNMDNFILLSLIKKS